MAEQWFTEFSDELARCLTDAETCATACEAHLETVAGGPIVDVLAAPAAIARVLIDLLDHPPELVLAAVRLCRDLAGKAAADENLPPEVAVALHRVADSAGDLLAAAR